MTDYLPITDAETDPGAPGTSELWKKWRDNPIAIAEGADGAPRVKSKAINLDSLTDSASGGAQGAVLVFADTRFVNFFYNANVSAAGGSSTNVSVRWSSDGGLTWSSWDTVLSLSSGSPHGSFVLDTTTGTAYGVGALTPSVSGANAVQFGTYKGSSSDKVSINVILYFHGTKD